MNDFQTATVIILGAQIAVAGGQAYLARRAQNKADKRDLRALTRLIEEVKSEFQKENSKVLNSLDIIKDKRGKNYTASQQSIVNYFECLTTLLDTIMEAFPANFKLENEEDLETFILNINTLKARFEVAKNMMDLLCENDEVIKNSENITFPLLEIQAHTLDSLRGYVTDIMYLYKVNKSRESTQLYQTSNEERQSILEELKSIYSKGRQFSVKYSEERLKLFVVVRKNVNEFRLVARNYLHSK